MDPTNKSGVRNTDPTNKSGVRNTDPTNKPGVRNTDPTNKPGVRNTDPNQPTRGEPRYSRNVSSSCLLYLGKKLVILISTIPVVIQTIILEFCDWKSWSNLFFHSYSDDNHTSQLLLIISLKGRLYYLFQYNLLSISFSLRVVVVIVWQLYVH